MLYAPGEAKDEAAHAAFCRRRGRSRSVRLASLPRGVVPASRHGDGSVVIRVEGHALRAKYAAVKVLMDADMNGYREPDSCGGEPGAFLFVAADGEICGCIVVRRIETAFRVIVASSSRGTAPRREASRSDVALEHAASCMLRYVSCSSSTRCTCAAIAGAVPAASAQPEGDAPAIPLCRGEDPVRAVLGVGQVWVSLAHRRRGVASRLLGAACATFVYGYRVPVDEVAFSHPTQAGRALAESFTGTREFLVYGA